MQISQCFVLATLAYSAHAAAIKNRFVDIDRPSSVTTLEKAYGSNDDAKPESQERRRRGVNDPPIAGEGANLLNAGDAMLTKARPPVKPDPYLTNIKPTLMSLLRLGNHMSSLAPIPTVNNPETALSMEEIDSLRAELHAAKTTVKGTEPVKGTENKPANSGNGVLSSLYNMDTTTKIALLAGINKYKQQQGKS